MVQGGAVGLGVSVCTTLDTVHAVRLSASALRTPKLQPMESGAKAAVVEAIGRFPLSVILSFLSESDGVALLITNQRLSRLVLPMYRIPKPAEIQIGSSSNQHRYQFRVVPVQDSSILLDRLNTKRLFRRRAPPVLGHTTEELAKDEWESRCNGQVPPKFPADLELLRFSSASPCDSRCGWNTKSSKTLLVSYPRSGNSLARHWLERATGVVTGSDTNPTRPLSQQLALGHGLVGEGLVNTPIVKSHWPERRGFRPITGRHRVILLVRNPYDAMDSYWNLNATLSHTKRLTDAMYTKFTATYTGLVKNEIHMWHAFLHYWLGDSTDNQVCVVRYEDLVRDPEGQVARMLQCVWNVSELSDFWKGRVQHAVISMPPRKDGSGFGKALGRYTPEMLEYIREVEQADPHRYMQRFGYSIVDQDFPHNFCDVDDNNPPYTDSWEPATSRTTPIQLNVGESIRPADCPYGRALREWRHSVTKNDTEPLPTV